VTRGMSYKFDVLNKYILRSSWEIWHKSSLENPILIRLVGLERLLRELPQEEIADLEDPKL